MVRHVARRILAAGWYEVVVVTGHEAEAVEAVLHDLPLRLVRNPDFASGQMSSVRSGLDALSTELEGVAICLADMVALRSSDYRALQEAFRARPRGEAIVPFYGGRRGNPVLLSRVALDAVLARGGRFGCRHFVDENADLVHRLDYPADVVLHDVDDPTSYAALSGR